MRTLFALCMILIAMALPAAGAVVSNTTVPATLIVNPATCPLVPTGTGIITGSGVLTFLIETTTTPSGTSHLGVHVHGHGKGTDQSGEQWTWSDADLFQPGVVNSSGNTTTQIIKEGFHLVGKKGRILIIGTFKVTVVDGTAIVTFEKGNETEDNEPCEGFFF